MYLWFKNEKEKKKKEKKNGEAVSRMKLIRACSFVFWVRVHRQIPDQRQDQHEDLRTEKKAVV